MKLSIIVPFYQVEDYFDECLASIMAQTRTDFECILVDDGSLDGSLAIAERYVAQDDRFRLVRQENAGLGPARNTGLDHAGGEFVMFVDSDDILSPRAVQLLVDSLENTGSDIAVGNARRFGTDAGVVQSWTHAEPCAHSIERTHILRHMSLYRDRMIWNKVFRRSFWDEHGFRFPAIRYEDYPVTLPAHVLAKQVDVFSDPVYFWRDRVSKDSITQQARHAGNALDRIKSANLVLDFLDTQIENSSAASLRDLRWWVRRYLIDVDVVAVTEAIVAADPVDQEMLLAAAKPWCARLEDSIKDYTAAVSDAMVAGIRGHDIQFLTALVEKQSGKAKALVRHRPSKNTARFLFHVGCSVAYHKVPKLVHRRLRAIAEIVEVSTDSVKVGFKIVLNPKLRQRAKVSVQVANDYRTFQLTPTRAGDYCRVEIPIAPLKADQEYWEQLWLTCRLQVGPLRWEGSVRPGARAEFFDLGDGLLFGDITGRGELGFSTLLSAPKLTGHWEDDGRLVLASVDGDPVLHIPAPGLPQRGVDGRLVVEPEVWANDIIDDPLSGKNIRSITVGGQMAMLMSAPTSFEFADATYALQRIGNLGIRVVRTPR